MLVMIGALIAAVVYALYGLLLVPTDWSRRASEADVLRHLRAHDVKRATIDATAITVELKDGTTQTVRVPADRDFGPALQQSGAELTIQRRR